ncbi:MAG: VWA domain-containing protein [Clostridium sp.]|nr:VWA domain-containing protein [Clostridium sp.]
MGFSLRKKSKAFCMIFAIIALSITSSFHVNAQAVNEVSDIVFLLDCSQSMRDIDENYMAPDFIKELAYVLPSHYRLGLVGYNKEICISVSLESETKEIEESLETVVYKDYGNAGAGMAEAVSLFQDDGNEKRIILLSDGENVMDSEENTDESAALFREAVREAKEKNIVIDVINLGKRVEEGENVYQAADDTGGVIYDMENGESLREFIEEYLFQQMDIANLPVGKLSGGSGELSVKLPDCMMREAKIILSGKQQNENMTLNCEADRMQVWKGKNYTVIELLHPLSEEVKIQMSSEAGMDVNAYLTAEYDFSMTTENTYIPKTQTARFGIGICNQDGKNLLDGHMKDGNFTVYLDGEEQEYSLSDGKAYVSQALEQDAVVTIDVSFDKLYGNYYGVSEVKEAVTIPEMIVEIEEEKEEAIDWFFWAVILIFAVSLIIIFCIAGKKRGGANDRKKVIDESRMLPDEKGMRGNDFCGKLVVYVIHNREGIDYPPESINLFARCNREMITLEWILDVCNLPLQLKGADKIIIRPGDDRSIIIKNAGKASAVKNREFLIKGHSYHLYYQEKVTFIFDEEDTEIEVHYKDLKPSER